MATVCLNNGILMPRLGLGTWQSPKGKAGNAVKVALASGYKHIDCAAIYANEAEIGEAFTESFKNINRKDVFITSKLWNTEHAPEDVKKACLKTLKDLQLSYLDLYLIHWPIHTRRTENMNGFQPVRDDVDIADTWAAMEGLVADGLVKSIGISNFNERRIARILKTAKIVPQVNQVENHPYLPQYGLVDFCTKHKIAVTAYSPLGTGNKPKLIEHTLVQTLAKSYKKSPANILCKWLNQRGIVAIPKSVTPSRIKENFNIGDFTISDKDMALISDMHKDHARRFIDPRQFWSYDVFDLGEFDKK